MSVAFLLFGSWDDRRVLPFDGATNVPTDAVVHVVLPVQWGLADVAVSAYRLRGPDGRLVPARATVTGNLVTLHPHAPLRRETPYTIEQAVLYRDGRRVGDMALARRIARAPPGAPPTLDDWERIWYPVSGFRTGPGPDRRTFAPPTLSEVTIDECAVLAEVTVAEALGPADLLAVEFESPPWLEVPRAVVDLNAERSRVQVGCSGGLDASAVRPVVVTGSGHALPAVHWTSIQRPAHRPQVDPLVGVGVGSVFDGVRFSEPRPPAPGPAACPYGVHGAGARERTEEEMRLGGVGVILQGHTLRVYERDGPGEWRLQVERGAAPLFAEATDHHVLAVWLAPDRHARWALVDRGSGVAFTGALPSEVRTGAWARPADGGFVVFGVPRIPGVIHAVRISTAGQATAPVALPMGRLLGGPASGWFIGDERRVVPLGADFAPTGAPMEVDIGVAVAAEMWGSIAVILSESEGRLFVSSADPTTGQVSPPTPVNEGRRLEGSHLVHAADGLAVSYHGSTFHLGVSHEDRWAWMLEPLACATKFPPGPPLRLDASGLGERR